MQVDLVALAVRGDRGAAEVDLVFDDKHRSVLAVVSEGGELWVEASTLGPDGVWQRSGRTAISRVPRALRVMCGDGLATFEYDQPGGPQALRAPPP